MIFLIETKILVSQLKKIRLQIQIVGCLGVDRVGLGSGVGPFWMEGTFIDLSSLFIGYVIVWVTLHWILWQFRCSLENVFSELATQSCFHRYYSLACMW